MRETVLAYTMMSVSNVMCELDQTSHRETASRRGSGIWPPGTMETHCKHQKTYICVNAASKCWEKFTHRRSAVYFVTLMRRPECKNRSWKTSEVKRLKEKCSYKCTTESVPLLSPFRPTHTPGFSSATTHTHTHTHTHTLLPPKHAAA